MERTLGCARCGDCCEEILMRIDFDPARFADDAPSTLNGDVAFIVEHWTRTGEVDLGEDGRSSTWSCDRFDPVRRLCGVHDDRPPVCQNYPWYGREPGPGKIINERCSYLLDLPPWERPAGARPLLPLTVLERA